MINSFILLIVVITSIDINLKNTLHFCILTSHVLQDFLQNPPVLGTLQKQTPNTHLSRTTKVKNCIYARKVLQFQFSLDLLLFFFGIFINTLV